MKALYSLKIHLPYTFLTFYNKKTEIQCYL